MSILHTVKNGRKRIQMEEINYIDQTLKRNF